MRKLTTLVVLALTLGALVSGGILFGEDIVQAASCDETVSPGESINAAITAAGAGGTVCVKVGVYKENVVVGEAGLVLRGVGGQPTVDAGGESTGDPGADSAIRITADGVTVQNFRVTNGGSTSGFDTDAGIRIESDNNIIINNTSTLNRRAGIWVADGDGNLIQGNHIIANSVCGIVLNDDSDGNTVKGNEVELNGSDGVRVQNNSDGNTIAGNNSHNNRGSGINVRSGPNNVMTGNNLDDNVLNGLKLHGADADGNTVAQNNASLNLKNGFLVQAGSTGNTFDRNQATANTVWGYEDLSAGAETGLTGNTYTKNKCRNNGISGSTSPDGLGKLCTPQTT